MNAPFLYSKYSKNNRIMIHFDKKQLLNTALWLVFTLFLCLPIHVEAQQKLKVHRCGNDLYRQALEVKHPGYIEREKRAFEMAEQSVLPRSGEVYRIPVVFHVIYNTNRQNIDDSLINNQIKVLNDAFRNRHADTVIPEIFLNHLQEMQK
jgi:hypothetical protein